MLCNGAYWKSGEARSGRALTSSRCTSLHNIRYGIRSPAGPIELQVSVAYSGNKYVATDVATPPTQGRKARCSTNNEARREVQRGRWRTPTSKSGRIPYALPKYLAAENLDIPLLMSTASFTA